MQTAAEKQHIPTQAGLELSVMESFLSIQGEGYHSGKPAFFIRLGGCDVGCHWCDVKESWEASDHPVLEVKELVQSAEDAGVEPVVVTGGEPLMQDLNELTKQLKNAGKKMWLETSGAYELTGEWHWICLSPKKFKVPVNSIYPHANELKVVIFNQSDFVWAEEHAGRVGADCKLFLQPEWDKREEMMPLIVEYIQKNPKWSVSLQTHKYLNIR